LSIVVSTIGLSDIQSPEVFDALPDLQFTPVFHCSRIGYCWNGGDIETSNVATSVAMMTYLRIRQFRRCCICIIRGFSNSYRNLSEIAGFKTTLYRNSHVSCYTSKLLQHFWTFSFLSITFRLISAHGIVDGGSSYVDPRFKRVLWYLIGSTKGGANRAKILELLNKVPANPNQLSVQLKMDYKTVIHHLKVLSENGLVITDNKDSYGATYFLTPLMENNYSSFSEILNKVKPKGRER